MRAAKWGERSDCKLTLPGEKLARMNQRQQTPGHPTFPANDRFRQNTAWTKPQFNYLNLNLA